MTGRSDVVLIRIWLRDGREDFDHVCDLEAIDTVISDTELADEMAEEIEGSGPAAVRE